MEHKMMALGLATLKNDILMVQFSLASRHFPGLWFFPGRLLPIELTVDKENDNEVIERGFDLARALELVADEFSKELSIGFDFSSGKWPSFYGPTLETGDQFFYFLPLLGSVISKDIDTPRIYLGRKYDDYRWVNLDRLANHSSALRMGILEPVILKTLSGFGLI